MYALAQTHTSGWPQRATTALAKLVQEGLVTVALEVTGPGLKKDLCCSRESVRGRLGLVVVGLCVC